MKKLLSFVGVALLALTIGVVGCDDDAAVTPVAPPTPAPIFGTVSGTVSVEGSGLAGVSVNLSGAASQSVSTGSSGGYSFDNVPAGTHSVQISSAPDGVTFASTATPVTITTSGQTATADFSGNYIRESTITGSVTAGSEGVVATVTATGAGMVMSEQAVVGSSDTDGDFELTGLRAGTYHVAISDFGDHEFTVTTRDVTVGVDQSVSVAFVAEAVPEPEVTTGSITGQVVTAAGVGIVATVTAVGTGEDGVTVVGNSDTEGDYELPPVEAGDYTVTISDFGDHEFAVSSRAVTVVAGQSVNASFAAEAVPEPEVTTGSITGQVVTAAGVGIVATVTAVGTGEDGVTVVGNSDTEGDYELPPVEAGDYTVTISDFGDHEFAVSSRAVTVVAGQSVNASFAAEADDGPTAGVFLLITGVTDNDGDEGKTSGRVTATIDIERGDARFEKIALYVDDDEVATQLFGRGPAPAEEPPIAAQQLGVVFSLSFDSDEYDPETGAVTYENGTYGIVAGVTFEGSEAEDYSQRWEVELENDDGYVVTADLGENTAIGDDGRRWYGGPSNGTIDITALRVSYTGGSVTSVGAHFCGEDATDLDGSDGYTFEFECEDHESNTDGTDGAVVGDMLTISSAGVDGVIRNDDHPFPAFVDFVGPTNSPIIVANRNGRENGWLNADVVLTGEVDAAEDDDENWLVEGSDETGGIGGYNMMLLMGEDLEKALEASPSSSLPAESADNDSYCAIASATDNLGNMSKLPDDNARCRPAPAGADVYVDNMMTPTWGQSDDGMVVTADVSEQTLEFGVDMTVPTIEFADDYDDDNRHNDIPNAFAFDIEDDESNVGNSGLHSTEGLLVGIRRRNASKTECLTIADDGAVVAGAAVDEDCDNTAITDEDVTLMTGVGVAYYTLSGMAQDAAGNSSDAISHTFVYDENDDATATAPSVPGVIEAGKPFNGASFLNDGLSIRDYYGAVAFENDITIGIGMPITVDEFNASSLTNRNHPVNATVNTYAGLQVDARNDVQELTSAIVAVRDQAQAGYTSVSTTFVANQVQDVPDTDKGFPAADADLNNDDDVAGFSYAFVFPGTTSSYSETTVCGIAECDAMDSKTSLKIEVKASADDPGTFSNPFERVDFLITDINGVSWTVGADASGTSGRVGGDVANTRNRTWSYSVTLSGTLLLAATRRGTDGDPTNDADDQDVMIRAIAVNDNNVGLLGSTAMPMLDTTAP